MLLKDLQPIPALPDLPQLKSFVKQKGWRCYSPNRMPDTLLLQMSKAFRHAVELDKCQIEHDALLGPMFAGLMLIVGSSGQRKINTDINMPRLINALQVYAQHIEAEIITRITGHGKSIDPDDLAMQMRKHFYIG